MRVKWPGGRIRNPRALGTLGVDRGFGPRLFLGRSLLPWTIRLLAFESSGLFMGTVHRWTESNRLIEMFRRSKEVSLASNSWGWESWPFSRGAVVGWRR